LIHLPGHTLESLGVFLPDRRVFVGGDTVMDLPFIWFGDSLEEIRTWQRIPRLRPKMILQGHGPPCGSARLAQDIRYLERVREKAREARRAGDPKRKFLETPLERVLPSGRVGSLTKGYFGAHKANLENVWNELAAAR